MKLQSKTVTAMFLYRSHLPRHTLVWLSVRPGITTGQTYTVTTGDSTTEVEMTSIIYGSGGMGGHGSMGGRNMGNGDMNGNEMGGPGGDMQGGPQMR